MKHIFFFNLPVVLKQLVVFWIKLMHKVKHLAVDLPNNLVSAQYFQQAHFPFVCIPYRTSCKKLCFSIGATHPSWTTWVSRPSEVATYPPRTSLHQKLQENIAYFTVRFMGRAYENELLPPAHRVSGFFRYRVSWRICISNKSPGDAAAAGLGTTLQAPLF